MDKELLAPLAILPHCYEKAGVTGSFLPLNILPKPAGRTEFYPNQYPRLRVSEADRSPSGGTVCVTPDTGYVATHNCG